MLRKSLKILALVAALGLSAPQAKGNSLVMEKVLRIAQAISVVQPNLPEEKYIEYALAIYRASKRYQIRPTTLVAIAQQETSFREGLPEGAAGEIGITQILKRWRKNPKFIREFGNITIKDLGDPSKSFLYSAWLLRVLKDNEKPGALPYWSYYNARKFRHRLRYFTHVNRHLNRIRKGLPTVVAKRAVASKRRPQLAMAGFAPVPKQPPKASPKPELPEISKKLIPKAKTSANEKPTKSEIGKQAALRSVSLTPGT